MNAQEQLESMKNKLRVVAENQQEGFKDPWRLLYEWTADGFVTFEQFQEMVNYITYLNKTM